LFACSVNQGPAGTYACGVFSCLSWGLSLSAAQAWDYGQVGSADCVWKEWARGDRRTLRNADADADADADAGLRSVYLARRLPHYGRRGGSGSLEDGPELFRQPARYPVVGLAPGDVQPRADWIARAWVCCRVGRAWPTAFLRKLSGRDVRACRGDAWLRTFRCDSGGPLSNTIKSTAFS